MTTIVQNQSSSFIENPLWLSQLKDKKEELSTRSVDFSIRDTTWLDHAKRVALFAFKTAAISYGAYYLGGSYIQRIGKFALQVLQSSNMQFLQGITVSNFIIQCQNLSERMLTESILQKEKVVVKALFYTITARYILQRMIMIPLYPAQSRIVKYLDPSFSTEKLNLFKKEELIELDENWISQDVILEKNGTRYHGVLTGCKDTIDNQKWVLQATGNAEPIEYSIVPIAEIYQKYGYNTLMINGPSVGNSQGEATPKSMGDAQQVGISFLETFIKAKNIVIAGRSLGGAAIGQAILQHDFKKDVNYLVISQMSFDKASNICGKTISEVSSLLGFQVRRTILSTIEMLLPRSNLTGSVLRASYTISANTISTLSPCLGWFVEKLTHFVGCEMDAVAAAKKLQELEIVQVVVQASNKEIPLETLPRLEDFQTDGPIQAKASLGHALIEQRITKKKVFVCLLNAEHMTNEAIRVAGIEIKKLGA